MFTRSMVSLVKESISVVHDAPHRVFRALNGTGTELGHLEYRLVDSSPHKAVDFYHTYTRPAAQGHGVAAKMVACGLDWAQSEKFSVIPTCSYVAAFLKKNPQYSSNL